VEYLSQALSEHVRLTPTQFFEFLGTRPDFDRQTLWRQVLKIATEVEVVEYLS